jgi:lambda family phage tail tape measure protein
MATERIEIIVTERGSKVVQRNLNQIGKSATQTGKAVQLLRRTLGLLGGALLIRELIQMVDQFTNLQNRLKLVTGSTAQLTLVTKKLFAISQETRSSFGATGDLFSRVALSVKALGISQKETLEFTKSLNQAVILSGAGAIEATQAVRQLSQGLASNRLSGDELRSVLEQLPLVADVIARELKITRGELRLFGKAGKITGEVVLKAFKNAREELERRFADTIPTIGQAFIKLSNAITFFSGNLATASGLSVGFARSMIFLAKHMETIFRLLGAAGITGLLLALPTIIGFVTAAVKGLTLAIIANPLGALIVILTTLISLAVVFADKINVFTTTFEDGTETVTTFSDILTGTFRGLGKLVDIGGTALDKFFKAFSGGNKGIGKVAFDTLKVFGSIINSFIKILQGLVVAVVTVAKAIGDIFFRTINSLITFVEFAIRQLDIPINAVREFLGKEARPEVSLDRFENPFEGAASDIGSKFADGFLAGFNADTVFDKLLNTAKEAFGGEVAGATQERLGQAIVDKASEAFAESQLAVTGPNIVKPKVDKSVVKFASFIRELKEENRLLELNADERERGQVLLRLEKRLKRELTVEERKQATALLILNQSLSKQAEILDQIQAPQMELVKTQAALNQLWIDGKITVDQYQQSLLAAQKASLETDRTLEGGLKKGLLSISEQFTDIASLAESTLVNAFQSAEDALVSFVQTGKVDFRSLIDSIEADLIRLAVRQAITAPIAGLFGPAAPAAGQAGTGESGLVSAFSGASSLFDDGGFFGTGGQGGVLLDSFLQGFQNGGRFKVGGSGGPDSQLVAFKATPGEEVEVNRPGSRNQRANTINFNISTPDADSFQRSQQQILAKTQATLQRANARNN